MGLFPLHSQWMEPRLVGSARLVRFPQVPGGWAEGWPGFSRWASRWSLSIRTRLGPGLCAWPRPHLRSGWTLLEGGKKPHARTDATPGTQIQLLWHRGFKGSDFTSLSSFSSPENGADPCSSLTWCS